MINSAQLPLPAKSMPKHVAFIMDGNGRWAKKHGANRSHGHEAGVKVVRSVLNAAKEWGIKYITLYAFSTENWSRPRLEVKVLMSLLKRYLLEETDEFLKENIKLLAIGDLDRLPNDVRNVLSESIKKLSDCTGSVLTLALSYGGRDEIVRALRSIAKSCANGELKHDMISEKTISDKLDTAGTPDPDLIVRTAGEVRISNFLLWQCAYAEYISVSAYWPEFSKKDFWDVLVEYGSRVRRFGGVK